ncbi:UNVERIFIED_CONTAM: hypothetical protein FKN15_037439 [Acipenser sinensis]
MREEGECTLQQAEREGECAVQQAGMREEGEFTVQEAEMNESEDGECSVFNT